MAAWGCKPFQNDLSAEYILTLVNTNIHSIIIESVDRETKYLKHKLAYYYDRFRAAIELMILFEENSVYSFARGYYDLAIEKLEFIKNDKGWYDSWNSGSKGNNYSLDIERQLISLKNLRDKSRT